MEMTNKNQKWNNLPPGMESGFVAIPRKFLEDLRNGLLTPTEFQFLCYTFLCCDITGKCYLNNRMVAEDLLGSEEKYDSAGNIIRDLKTKSYINFPERQGERGSFPVSVDNFLTSRGYYTNLKKAKPHSEVGSSFPKLTQENNPEDIGKRELVNGDEFRSKNNKNENKNEIKDIVSLRDALREKKIVKK